MPKRTASGELNHENWDNDEEPEERGHFQSADPDKVKERKIKVARRRALDAEDDKGTGNLFKSFTGFGAAPSASKMSFSFGQNSSTMSQTTSTTMIKTASTSESDQTAGNRAKHLKSLKSLNSAVLKWLEEHINKDPYCVLSPIFVDYNNHIKEIEKKYPYEEETDHNSNATLAAPSLSKTMASNETFTTPFNFMKSSTSTTTKKDVPFSFPAISTASNSTEKSLPFAFSYSGNSSSTTVAKSNPLSTPMFSFTKSGPSITTNNNNALLTLTTSSSSTLFSFGNLPKPAIAGVPKFSFANGDSNTAFATASSSIRQSTNIENDGDDNGDYVPPKPEVREIKEDNSAYSIRCKLFYKSENEWKEKGLGNMHIKPIETGKFQLLLRADTNLGNILLNIMVTKDMPFKVMKNNVSFVCIPSPPLNPQKAGDTTPVPMLLRVKTQGVAEELLAEINKHRGI